MKISCKIAALVALTVTTATFAAADTIQLGSYATGASSLGNANTAMNYAGYSAASTTPSTGTASSVALDPSTVWAGPITGSTWVGNSSTAGPVGTSNPAFGYYTYTTTFTAAWASTEDYSGTLTILADDTAEVLLNGNVLIPFGALGGDLHCADAAPTCLTTDTVDIGLTALLAGVDANTLTIVVEQMGTGPTGGTGDPSGLDFSSNLSAVPEPSTLMLLGTGLLGSAGALFRRMRS
jgi:hypothetical protein